MIKYLNYVQSEIIVNEKLNGDKKNFLISKLSNYISLWNYYKNDDTLSVLHPEEYGLLDTHNFQFPTNETIQISWDIDKIYRKSAMIQPKKISLTDIEKLIIQDISNSIYEFTRVENEVKSIYKHKYAAVLIFYFSPQNAYIMLDGRHRFIEERKFKKNGCISAFILDSDNYLDCLIHKKDHLAYIILHNIKIISNCLGGCGNLDGLLEFQDKGN